MNTFASAISTRETGRDAATEAVAAVRAGLGGATLVILICLAVVLLGGIVPGILLDWSGQASAFLAVVK